MDRTIPTSFYLKETYFSSLCNHLDDALNDPFIAPKGTYFLIALNHHYGDNLRVLLKYKPSDGFSEETWSNIANIAMKKIQNNHYNPIFSDDGIFLNPPQGTVLYNSFVPFDYQNSPISSLLWDFQWNLHSILRIVVDYNEDWSPILVSLISRIQRHLLDNLHKFSPLLRETLIEELKRYFYGNALKTCNCNKFQFEFDANIETILSSINCLFSESMQFLSQQGTFPLRQYYNVISALTNSQFGIENKHRMLVVESILKTL